MNKIALVLIIIMLNINIAVAEETIRISSPTPTAYAQIKEGTLVGPYIEIIKIIFNEFGVTVKPVPLPWARAIKYLKNGEIDAIAPIFYSDERSRFAKFSSVFDLVDTRVFTKKGKFDDFTTWDDLKGHQGIVVRGRSDGVKFDNYAAENLKLEETNSLEQVIRMIMMDRVDYGIDKYYDTIAESKKLGLFEKIHFMPVSISTNETFIGISKKSPFLKYLPHINGKIKQLNQEGTIRKLLLENLEKTVVE
jgi:polar amino acid transport system substrate-binding protein